MTTSRSSDAYGAFYARVGLALAWTATNTGSNAKACRESGSGSWKQARPLSPEPGAAAGFFTKKLATRNPVITATANKLILFDGDGAPLGELAAVHGLVLPSRAWRVATARGAHLYASAPQGHPGLKVELTPDRVTVITDGYLLAPPGRHPSGLVYEFENVDIEAEDGRPSVLDVALLDRLHELAGGGRARVAELVDSGEPIQVNDRHAALMHHASKLRGDGLGAKAITAALEELQARFVEPTGRPGEIDSIVRWVMRKNAPPPLDSVDVELLSLLDELPGSSPPAASPVKPKPKGRKQPMGRRPITAIDPERVEWLIPGLVPLGTLTLVAGVGGLGKSALLLAWAKEITAAGESVLLVSYEDAAAQVIRPRFEALGGDLARLFVLELEGDGGEISFPADLPELERHVRETGARAILLDPVSAAIDLKLDAHRDQDVRVVLGKLARLAERSRLSVIENAHLNKAPSSDPYLRINGSTAFYNAARSVLSVTRDPVDPDWSRLVAHHKSNYSQVSDVQRWRVEPVSIFSERGPIETIKLEFVEIAEGVSREEVLATRPAETELDKAVIFLAGSLADGEWHDSAGLKILAGVQRISERTLKRAAQDLEVEHVRRGFPASTWWRLQSGQPFSPESGPTGETA